MPEQEIITMCRRRGRPPLVSGERTVSVTFSVPESHFDELSRRAAAARLDLAPYLRQRLAEDFQMNNRQATTDGAS